jgi:cystathionine beta-lyase/cystathionine gamma-synthase
MFSTANPTNMDDFPFEDWNDEYVLQKIGPKNGAPMYCRSMSNQAIELSNELKKVHPGSSEAFVTPSGMAALSATVQAVLEHFQKETEINIIAANELYCDTLPMIEAWANRFQSPGHSINIIQLPVESSEGCLQVFKSLAHKVNVLIIESCSNPSQYVFDFSMLEKFRQNSQKLIVIVDNTWLSHVIFNPFTIQDVDVVVYSLSKYYSGGTTIAGAILLRNENLTNQIIKVLKLVGSHVCPKAVDTILKALPSMETRIVLASNKLAYLHKILSDSKFAIAACKPNQGLAEKYFLSYPLFFPEGNDQTVVTCLPPILTFFVNKNSNNALTKLLQSSGIRFATSFGGFESRIDNWPKRMGDNLYKCRLSIGFTTTDPELNQIAKFLVAHVVKDSTNS